MKSTKTAILLAFVLLVAAGCSKNKEQRGETETAGGKVQNVSDISNFEKRDNQIPNFSWQDKDGKTVTFDQFRGKVTLVNFWATWCGPCKRELPDLIALSNEMESKNVRVLGISTDRGSGVLEEVKSFVGKEGITYQIIISTEDLEEAFGNIRVIPTTFLIDADGKIAQTIVGGRSKEQFTEAINAILK